MDITTNFIAGRMNKSVDERLIPKGEYKNALNVRLGSTETTDIGAVENSKGNEKLTTLEYNGNPLSINATCLGAFADPINETMYWFVHDDNPSGSSVDLIVSYNTTNQTITYHVISVSVLNFNPTYLITGVQLVEDLLFFTDNYNPPRVINVKSSYPTPTGLNDNFTEEDISLIVKPPGFNSFLNPSGQTVFDLATPEVTLYKTQSEEENFLTDRFISFAYRYRYKDKQYSATSLFTLAVFDTLEFNVEPETMVNEGMENRANSVEITHSTGSEKVKEIQLLYKESSSSVIYIVETFIKEELGWGDNELKTFTFTSNKVYGTLGSDELLRQFDNVPLLANALTIQGNRLMLGNYTEGYDIVTANNQPIPISFSSKLSKQQVTTGIIVAPTTLADTGNSNFSSCYRIAGPIIAPYYSTCNDFQFALFDLATVPLPILPGIEFNFQMQIYSYETTGMAGASLNTNNRYQVGTSLNPIVLNFTYTATKQFNSVAEMLSDNSFKTAIGVFVDPTTAIADAPTGGTLMDAFNQAILSEVANVTTADGFIDDFEFVFESINSQTINQILTYSGPVPNRLGGSGVDNCFYIKFPAVAFVPINSLGVPMFNYFRFVLENVQTGNPSPYAPLFSSYSLRPTVQSSGLIINQTFNNRSLHSNRDYEAGIVYLDEYGRATTALVCPTNTVFIPCENSIFANRINISINNKPPFWAKKYKFVLKQSRASYDTIYIRRFYEDPTETSIYWFALEGEDKALVKEGTKLVVKRDDGGPLSKKIIATVLDVESKIRGEFITDISLPGLYMSMKTTGFSVRGGLSDSINYGQNPLHAALPSAGNDPYYSYPVPQIYNAATDEYDLAKVPTGAVIKIIFRVWRTEWDPWLGSHDDSVDWRWEQTFISPQNYDDFYAWWDGENIESYAGGTSNTGQTKVYLPPKFMHGPSSDPFLDVTSAEEIDNGIPVSSIPHYGIKYAFLKRQNQNGITYKKYHLQLRANIESGGWLVDDRPAHVNMEIQFYGQDDLLIFETAPPDADPNLFYDSSEMYDIANDINGDLAHSGEIQNQVVESDIPAIVQLPHFNCYTYYNGAESYKIEDSATGKALSLGQRTTAISTEPYAKELRQSSVTYSGIYYPSSGVNNSNEFNLGLANYKDLETNFGPVMKLHARETDMLVLQEDRISYVLLGKNLISDSVGGGAIISVPEVLGKQIARIEEYGISFNPESFTSWGKNMYFSDVKRGAILQLTGGSLQSDNLNVISDTGMRSYFRDKFIGQLKTQKLGGYDPYMDEYVFSSNTNQLPLPFSVAPCGRLLTFRDATPSTVYKVTIEVGALIGAFNLTYNVLTPTTATLDIDAIFNGVTTSVSGVSGIGALNVQKTSVYPTTVDITIIASEKCTYTFNPLCIKAKSDTFVTQFVLMESGDGRKKFNYGYNWTDGIYNSPTSTDTATRNWAVNRVCPPSTGILTTQVNSGIASSGLIPYSDCTVDMFVEDITGGLFNFDLSRGHNLYAYTQRPILAGCNNILADLTTQTPLTITTPVPGKHVGSLTNLKLTGSTYTNTNAPTAPANYIADLGVDFTTLQITVGDTVVSAAGITGTVLSVAANLIQTGIGGVVAMVVQQNEAYTITRLNLSQIVLVYDLRDKMGANVCEDLDPVILCTTCTGLCTEFVCVTQPLNSALNACLWSSSPYATQIGVAHNGASPLPIIGNIVFRSSACDPNNVLADGWYWMNYSGPSAPLTSDEYMQVENGICIDRQTITCN